MNELELWAKAHQLSAEAHSLCVLGWIKPEHGNPHINRLRKTVDALSGAARAIEQNILGTQPPKIGD